MRPSAFENTRSLVVPNLPRYNWNSKGLVFYNSLRMDGELDLRVTNSETDENWRNSGV